MAALRGGMSGTGADRATGGGARREPSAASAPTSAGPQTGQASSDYAVREPSAAHARDPYADRPRQKRSKWARVRTEGGLMTEDAGMVDGQVAVDDTEGYRKGVVAHVALRPGKVLICEMIHEYGTRRWACTPDIFQLGVGWFTPGAVTIRDGTARGIERWMAAFAQAATAVVRVKVGRYHQMHAARGWEADLAILNEASAPRTGVAEPPLLPAGAALPGGMYVRAIVQCAGNRADRDWLARSGLHVRSEDIRPGAPLVPPPPPVSEEAARDIHVSLVSDSGAIRYNAKKARLAAEHHAADFWRLYEYPNLTWGAVPGGGVSTYLDQVSAEIRAGVDAGVISRVMSIQREPSAAPVPDRFAADRMLLVVDNGNAFTPQNVGTHTVLRLTDDQRRAYEELFDMGGARWHLPVFACSASARHWGLHPSFDAITLELRAMASARGWIVTRAEELWSDLAPLRVSTWHHGEQPGGTEWLHAWDAFIQRMSRVREVACAPPAWIESVMNMGWPQVGPTELNEMIHARAPVSTQREPSAARVEIDNTVAEAAIPQHEPSAMLTSAEADATDGTAVLAQHEPSAVLDAPRAPVEETAAGGEGGVPAETATTGTGAGSIEVRRSQDECDMLRNALEVQKEIAARNEAMVAELREQMMQMLASMKAGPGPSDVTIAGVSAGAAVGGSSTDSPTAPRPAVTKVSLTPDVSEAEESPAAGEHEPSAVLDVATAVAAAPLQREETNHDPLGLEEIGRDPLRPGGVAAASAEMKIEPAVSQRQPPMNNEARESQATPALLTGRAPTAKDIRVTPAGEKSMTQADWSEHFEKESKCSRPGRMSNAELSESSNRREPSAASLDPRSAGAATDGNHASGGEDAAPGRAARGLTRRTSHTRSPAAALMREVAQARKLLVMWVSVTDAERRVMAARGEGPFNLGKWGEPWVPRDVDDHRWTMRSDLEQSHQDRAETLFLVSQSTKGDTHRMLMQIGALPPGARGYADMDVSKLPRQPSGAIAWGQLPDPDGLNATARVAKVAQDLFDVRDLALLDEMTEDEARHALRTRAAERRAALRAVAAPTNQHEPSAMRSPVRAGPDARDRGVNTAAPAPGKGRRQREPSAARGWSSKAAQNRTQTMHALSGSTVAGDDQRPHGKRARGPIGDRAVSLEAHTPDRVVEVAEQRAERGEAARDQHRRRTTSWSAPRGSRVSGGTANSSRTPIPRSRRGGRGMHNDRDDIREIADEGRHDQGTARSSTSTWAGSDGGRRQERSVGGATHAGRERASPRPRPRQDGGRHWERRDGGRADPGSVSR